MFTGIVPTPTIHVYSEINIGKYKCVKHYDLVEVKNSTAKLSQSINIQLDRGFAKSNPTYWLKVRELKKWVTLTGLFETSYTNIFIADKGKTNIKQSLIIVVLDNKKRQNLSIYYFENYYTNDLNKVLHFIEPK
jgi:hypothetical protein